MKTETKYFGQIEYDADDVISFIGEGLFGFEDEREFLLIPFEGNGTLFCLQSVKTPGLAFVAVEPLSLDPGYDPVLQPEELRAMGVEESGELAYYSLCAVKSPVAGSTVNLRCPVVINGETRKAMQAILEDGRYGMRHLLSDIRRQEEQEETPC